MNAKTKFINKIKSTKLNKFRNKIKVKMKQTSSAKLLQEAKNKKSQETKEINKFIYNWIQLMAFCHLDNDMDETFSLTEIKKTTYGFKCNINIVNGLSFSKLESEEMIKTIENNLGCKFITTSIPKAQHLKAEFIMSDIPSIDFEPYIDAKGKKLAPYQIYVGTGIDGTPLFVNMLDYPHCLIQGATGMGKTKLIDSIITNLIVSNSPEDLSLYFIQVDKSDQIIYRKCKHSKAYGDDIYKALAIVNYLKAIVDARDKILRPFIEDGICENIFAFNKVCKKYNQNKFSYIYLVIDEFSSLMPSSESADKDKKAIKTEIQESMERLIAIGRYVGIYVVIGLQRATIDKIPSFLKANSNTIITFKVNNRKSSEVAIDSNEATELLPREFIVKTSKKILGKTTTLYPSTILDYIKPFRVTNAQYQDFNYLSWFNPEVGTKKEQKRKETKESKNAKRKAERYGKNDTKFTQNEIEQLETKNRR
ncbi:MAG TPA: FtsK/SpoIIIE domain-containing protein [Clostridium sp.]|uniref:FtsK/SpoIIIE domain-containing protein n=1 Tax=Clostridium sp. TaxID=1506 RepID=UPI002F92C848